jgi:alpha-glucosidase
MGYCFELLTNEFSATHIRTTAEGLEAKLDGGWPCWAISNHDVERVVTRWGGDSAPAHFANQLTALLCSLRGSVCVYQGEELGLTEAAVPFESLQDPYGVAFWPSFKGRDGCRTPMPWRDHEHVGFSEAKPWLPAPDEHRAASVERQEADAASTLHGFRAFMRWRKSQPALRFGDIRFIDAPEPMLVFARSSGDEELLAAFNLASEPVQLSLPEFGKYRQVESSGVLAGELHGEYARVPGHGVVFAVRRRV